MASDDDTARLSWLDAPARLRESYSKAAQTMRAIADDENLASDETLVTIADVIRQIVRVSTDRYNEVDAVLSQLYAGRREREGGNT